MFEEYNKNKIFLNNHKEKKKRVDEVDQNRRNLLIGSGLFAAAGTLLILDWKIDIAKTLRAFFADWKKGSIKKEEVSNKNENIVERKMEKISSLSMSEIINFDMDRIILDESKIASLENYWKNEYIEGKRKIDFRNALGRMEEWELLAKKEFYFAEFVLSDEKQARIKKIILMTGGNEQKFKENFKSCFYLAIPESFWRLNAESKKNSAGPFQLSEKIARDYGLKIKYNYDERRDPLKSAKVAAQNILDLYISMKGNWGLVISGYNGGLIWGFKKEAIKDGKKLDYAHYLKYLECKINEAKDAFSQNKQIFHKASKNDKWDDIAKKYNLDKKQLLVMNHLKCEDPIKPNQNILIPGSLDNRKKAFYVFIAGFIENIEYLAKFRATKDIMETEEKKTKIASVLAEKKNGVHWKKEIIVQQVNLFFKRTIAKGDTLFKLAKKFEVSVSEIVAKNGSKKIIPGEEVLIRKKGVQPLTLASLAQKERYNFENLIKLNPAIKNPLDAFPDGEVLLRIPA